MRFANFLRIPCLQNTSGRVLLKFSLTIFVIYLWKCLTLSWWRPLSYRNQSIDFGSKPMDWLLYDNGLRLERVNNSNVIKPYHKLISKRYHCVKCVQIRSNFWSVFSRIQTEYSVRMRENTDQKLLRIWTLFTQCISLGINFKTFITYCISILANSVNTKCCPFKLIAIPFFKIM